MLDYLCKVSVMFYAYEAFDNALSVAITIWIKFYLFE